MDSLREMVDLLVVGRRQPESAGSAASKLGLASSAGCGCCASGCWNLLADDEWCECESWLIVIRCCGLMAGLVCPVVGGD